jgi:iron complex outermembrane receptor protein
MTSVEFKEHQEDDAIRLLVGYKKYLKKGHLSLKSALIQQSVFYENERTTNSSLTQTSNWYNVLEWKQSYGKGLQTNFRLNTTYNQINPGSNLNQMDRKQLSAFQSIDYNFNPKWKVGFQLREEFILDEGNYFLPAAKLSFKPNTSKDFSLFAKAGKNLKYPSLNDLYWQPGGNPDLKAEVSQTAEIGMQNQISVLSKRYVFNWKTALYASLIDNYIQWQPTAFGYWQALNLKEVASRGVEIRAELKSRKAKLEKELRFNYTYTSSTNQASNHAIDHSVGKQLIYIPEHQYNVNLSLKRKGYSFNYNFQFMGARYTTSDNESFLPYYTLSDLSIGKQFEWDDQSLQLSFAVMNVFDTEYQAIEWRPMPNRNYLLTLKYKIQP